MAAAAQGGRWLARVEERRGGDYGGGGVNGDGDGGDVWCC